jgi:hypothetical protein
MCLTAFRSFQLTRRFCGENCKASAARFRNYPETLNLWTPIAVRRETNKYLISLEHQRDLLKAFLRERGIPFDEQEHQTEVFA